MCGDTEAERSERNDYPHQKRFWPNNFDVPKMAHFNCEIQNVKKMQEITI